VHRDTLNKLKEDGRDDSLAFFNGLQYLTRNNIKLKAPVPDQPELGWRVEFRPMDIQLTDFENAAYVCFVMLLSRAILSSRLSFLIPISKVEENMTRATKRNAVLNEKFYFNWRYAFEEAKDTHVNNYTEMTVNEIINGKPSEFPGLVPLIQQYLDSIDVDSGTRHKIDRYLMLIQGRARGDLWTLARFTREFVLSHPNYKKDSVVSEDVCYDLMKVMQEIAEKDRIIGLDQPDGQKDTRSSSMLGPILNDRQYSLLDAFKQSLEKCRKI